MKKNYLHTLACLTLFFSCLILSPDLHAGPPSDPPAAGLVGEASELADPCLTITTLSCGVAVSAITSGTGNWNVTACGFSTPGQEVMYSFTPTVTGLHSIQVNSVSGGYIDYFYKAASGGCNASGWTCIDDINFTGTFPIGTLTAGTQYYILLDPENTGAYNHNFQISCPATDPCSIVASLTCGTPVTASMTGSGTWNNLACGFTVAGQEKIYSFTPTTTGAHTLQVTSSSGGYIDYMYKAASGGCSSTGWTCIDDISITGTYSLATLTAGTQYYILLDAESTSAVTHTFQINCPVGAPDPCSSITALTCATVVTASMSGTGAWSNLTCGFSTPGQEKVYSFTPTTTGTHTLQVTSASGSYIDYMYKAASGGCSSTGWTCIDDISFTGTYTIGSLTAGTQYYILLDPETTSAVTHSFQINCPMGAPDPCLSITTLACATPVTATLTGAGAWNNVTCGFSTPGQEKLYSFTPTTTGVHNIQVTLATGTGYMDYQYKPVSGGCSATGWTCIDDVNFTGTFPIGTLTAGVPYYILLDGESTTSSTQAFQVVCPAGNDPCTSITTLACATPVTASLTGAGIWSNLTCGFSTLGQEKVYSFTPTVTGVHNLQVTSTSGSYIDYMYKAAPGGCSSTGWTCIDDVSIAGTYTIGALTAGVQYYILLDAESTGSVSHTFQVNCPAPDPCTSVTTLACATPVTLTLSGAGAWNSATCGFSTPGQEKLYSFTPATTGIHNIQVTSATGTGYMDYQYKPVSGGCSATGWTCIDDINFTGTFTIGTLTAGVEYYILLDAESSTSSTQTFQINCPQLAPCVAAPTSPTNGQTNICPSATQTLSWPASSGATSYDVYFGTSPTPSFVSNTTGTSYVASTPAQGIYYWQIRPVSSSGTATGCTIWSFTQTDNTQPVINCPANQTVNADQNCAGVVGAWSSVSKSDNCTASGSISESQAPASGTVLSGHNTTQTLTLTANDGNGNTGTCTFTVTLKDVSAPTITCPANQTVAANASCAGTIGSWSSLSKSDNCAASGGIAESQSPSSGTVLSGHNTTQTVTLTANDGNGNTGTCTFTVTLKDVTAPVITCPANQTVAANASCAGAVGSWNSLSKSDNCAASGSISESQSPSSGTVLSGHNAAQTVTLTASDGNGNTGTCTFTVTLKDVTAPTITCPANQTVAANASCSGTVGSWNSLSKSDNCAASGGIAESQSPASGTVLSGHNTTQTVTLTANDGNGNTGTCTFSVTLKDVSAPTVTCPANQTLAANASCAGTVGSWNSLSKSDNCAASGSISESQSPSSGTVLSGHNAAQTVTLTANDGNGNTGTCTFTVTLKDVTAPTITCPANQTVAANASCAGTVGSWNSLSKSDNCAASGSIAETQSPASGTVLSGHNTTQTVTLTANDGNGNTGTCTFSVTLKDVSAPTVTCPANQTLAANASCAGTIGSWSSTAKSDNCTASGSISESQSPSSGTVLSGHNAIQTVTLTANDGNGNTGTCTFTVTLKDVTAPTITCPANQTVAANVSCSGTVGSWNSLSKSDNCAASGSIAETQSPASGTVLSGHNTTQTVTLTANDGNGNSSTCTFTVTLKDLTAPLITCPANQTLSATSGCSGQVGEWLLISKTDNCVASGSIIENQIPGSGTVLSGHNDVEIITLTATDGNGNTATCTFTVTLKDITAPVITCPANQTVNANASCAGTVGAWNLLSRSDNCTASGSITQTQSPVATTVLSGHNDVEVVTLTASDGNGNTSNCTFTVTLKDVTAPVVTCPANQTVTANAGCAGTVGAWGLVSRTDNCTGSAGITQTQTPAATTVLSGHNDVEVVTLTGNDGNGNTASCTFTVTLKDLTAPLITCPANQTVNAGANCSGTVGVRTLVSKSDNCTGAASITESQSPPAGTILSGHNDVELVTLTANDGNGNTDRKSVV